MSTFSFSFQKSDFRKAVTIAKKALPKVIISEERGHLLVKIVGESARVSTTNNDILCYVDIPTKSSKDFSFTCDPKIIEKLSSKVEDDLLRGEYDDEKYLLKMFTSADKNSFITCQTFPSHKMLTFDKTLNLPSISEVEVNRVFLKKALDFTSGFLLPLKEDGKNNDFIIINNKVCYAGNGRNRRGYFVCKHFAGFSNLKIRKAVVPHIISDLEKLTGENVVIIENPKIIAIKSEVDGFLFGFLKSEVQPPRIPLDFLKKEGPFTRIHKNSLIKRLDRLILGVANPGSIGIKIALSGDADDAHLKLSLLNELDCMEDIPCSRVSDDSAEDIESLVEYKMFKEILSSIESTDVIDLYINSSTERAFKVYFVGVENNEKFIAVGAGAYARSIG